MQSLQDSFMTWLGPNMKSHFDLQLVRYLGCGDWVLNETLTQSIRKQIKGIKSRQKSDSRDVNHRTICHEIFNGDLPAAEKSNERL